MASVFIAAGTNDGMTDRAFLAKVTASSFRVSTLAEIPRAAEFSSTKLDRPDNWPRRVPLYAADASPVTFWATEGSGPEHLQYDFANRLARRVSISGFRVLWGDHPARDWLISVSDDGKKWKTVKEGHVNGEALEQIKPDSPVLARFVRLDLIRGAGGFTVRSFAVSGSEEEVKPPRAAASAPAPGLVELSWKGEGSPYRFCIHRAKDKNFPPSSENLLACTDEQTYTDRGVEAGEWFYRVAAESFGGNSAASETVAVNAGALPAPAFEVRGVVEGFYNDPWPHQERLRVIAMLSAARMNYYLYAPKHDAYHRQLWREPYPPEEISNFAELAAACRARGITFNYGLSPGLDYKYTEGDFNLLLKKISALFDAGARSFTLLMDDIPASDRADAKTAGAQAALANRLLAALREKDPVTELWFVPTVYIYTYERLKKSNPGQARYLEKLRALDPSIRVMWTGPGQYFSETITRPDAESIVKAIGRKPLIWDNNPVNDVSLRNFIIMAPYLGRDPALTEATGGILLNPMYLPNSSMITVLTAGSFMADPWHYDPNSAYQDAVRLMAGEKHYDALRALADTLAFHPLFPSVGVDRLPAYRMMQAFWAAGGGNGPEREQLMQLFLVYTQIPAHLRKLDNHGLAEELREPAEKLAHYGQAGVAALDYLSTTDKTRKETRRQIVEQNMRKARDIPWMAGDSRLNGVFTPEGASAGVHDNIFEAFIQKALAQR